MQRVIRYYPRYDAASNDWKVRDIEQGGKVVSQKHSFNDAVDVARTMNERAAEALSRFPNTTQVEA